MEISYLNIAIFLFTSLDDMKKFIKLAGYSQDQLDNILKNYESVIWSKTCTYEYALYFNTLNAIEKINKNFI